VEEGTKYLATTKARKGFLLYGNGWGKSGRIIEKNK
jgi:hypothetical protein